MIALRSKPNLANDGLVVLLFGRRANRESAPSKAGAKALILLLSKPRDFWSYSPVSENGQHSETNLHTQGAARLPSFWAHPLQTLASERLPADQRIVWTLKVVEGHELETNLLMWNCAQADGIFYRYLAPSLCSATCVVTKLAVANTPWRAIAPPWIATLCLPGWQRAFERPRRRQLD